MLFNQEQTLIKEHVYIKKGTDLHFLKLHLPHLLKKKSIIIKIQTKNNFRRPNMDGGSSYPIHFLIKHKSLLNFSLISA